MAYGHSSNNFTVLRFLNRTDGQIDLNKRKASVLKRYLQLFFIPKRIVCLSVCASELTNRNHLGDGVVIFREAAFKSCVGFLKTVLKP